MADSVEDKGLLTERLEEDRRRMAIQVSALMKDYEVANRLRASVQKYPLVLDYGCRSHWSSVLSPTSPSQRSLSKV